MRLSYYSQENNEKTSHLIVKHNLTYICYSNFDKIIKPLLCDFCDIDICGYNADKKNYWGKRLKNNKCVLMFTLVISSDSITINPIIGDENCIKYFYINLREGLEIYKTSPFLFKLVL